MTRPCGPLASSAANRLCSRQHTSGQVAATLTKELAKHANLPTQQLGNPKSTTVAHASRQWQCLNHMQLPHHSACASEQHGLVMCNHRGLCVHKHSFCCAAVLEHPFSKPWAQEGGHTTQSAGSLHLQEVSCIKHQCGTTHSASCWQSKKPSGAQLADQPALHSKHPCPTHRHWTAHAASTLSNQPVTGPKSGVKPPSPTQLTNQATHNSHTRRTHTLQTTAATHTILCLPEPNANLHVNTRSLDNMHPHIHSSPCALDRQGPAQCSR